MTASPHDFDFLQGTWAVANRRLKARLAGADEWDEFPARQVFWKLLGGVANVDEFDCPALGFKGMSVRTLDLAQGRWSIYWVGSNDGILQPPVHGGFDGERGEFFGDDTFGGRPIRVRFRWTVSETAPVWEQAFSPDGGASWETNWIMRFSREGQP
jgi:hypothetical protein